jgi:hypothetical protein
MSAASPGMKRPAALVCQHTSLGACRLDCYKILPWALVNGAESLVEHHLLGPKRTAQYASKYGDEAITGYQVCPHRPPSGGNAIHMGPATASHGRLRHLGLRLKHASVCHSSPAFFPLPAVAARCSLKLELMTYHTYGEAVQPYMHPTWIWFIMVRMKTCNQREKMMAWASCVCQTVKAQRAAGLDSLALYVLGLKTSVLLPTSIWHSQTAL